MKFSLVSAALVLGFAGHYTLAEEAQKIEPSTCYLSAAWGFGQVACTDEKGTPSQLVAAEVSVDSSRDQESNEVRLTITGVTSHENVWGTYSLKGEDGEIVLVGIKPVEPVAEVRGGRGGGGYRGGGARFHGGGYRGGVAYRGGGYYRRGYGGVAAGAIVGGAAAAAASGYYGSNYCDPNYQNCGYYGSGYYAPGVVGGAVVGAGVAAARRGGAYYRGGGAYRRGGGAHVAHRGGGRRR
jgi:hypothetical protein